MKKVIGPLLLCFFSFITIAQSQEYDEIKIKVIMEKQPLPGTSIIIENSENQNSFNTDFDGEAKIKIPKDKDLVRLSFLGPIVRVKILRPVDSITVNLDKKRAHYFLDGKKMNRRKIKFSGY